VNCEEFQNLLHGYLDGELDLVGNLEVERHLRQCSTCPDALSRYRALRAALGHDSLYRRPTVDLRERIRSSLRAERNSRATILRRSWRPLALAASLALAAFLGWSAGRLGPGRSAEDALAQEVISSHVRSMMAGHLEDVHSSDTHSVKPWFNGRVGFSPMVMDLGQKGFPLVGGRLDFVNNQESAALVYKRNQHVINVFMWPSTAEEPLRELTRQGYIVFHWSKAGLTCWVISDLNKEELRQFVQLFL
jgi:anti-sigma factor RsiW